MSHSKRITLFVILFIVLYSFLSLPGLFDLANRIEPWVLGVPFVMFWTLFLSFLICCLMISWYIVDAKNGDFDIDEVEESEIMDFEERRARS
ncbi:hypothetical protein ACFSCZ_14075 [Siminovitchia sediminis]|uniref:DUF3311 domain-containing protein n=1 Tax=Siminovitchia sediminis TaxID=1274353 RepID=A0ABW4KI82_9BACI